MPASLSAWLTCDHEKTHLYRLARFTECARLVTGLPYATAEQGATFLEALTTDLNISRLSTLCSLTKQVPELGQFFTR